MFHHENYKMRVLFAKIPCVLSRNCTEVTVRKSVMTIFLLRAEVFVQLACSGQYKCCVFGVPRACWKRSLICLIAVTELHELLAKCNAISLRDRSLPFHSVRHSLSLACCCLPVRVSNFTVCFLYMLKKIEKINPKKRFTGCLLSYIYAGSNRSRIACVMLVPDPVRTRIQNLQNRIGSGLKKIRVRTPLGPSLPLSFRSSFQPHRIFSEYAKKSRKATPKQTFTWRDFCGAKMVSAIYDACSARRAPRLHLNWRDYTCARAVATLIFSVVVWDIRLLPTRQASAP